MNLVCPKSISIIIVLLAIIVPISHSEIQLLISSIIDYFESIYFHLPLPVDGPIFRDLANTTTNFLKVIAKVNIPPSPQIIDQRPKGLFLANVADKVGHASQIENQIIVQYLKDLAENAYQTGKKS
ncbi:hypothetical protein F8M41_022140 [Gigaspora margarita]|uniref:Uncharacterized protein n=1 Tax=Gigaspora margarita TaxID=4874 RepID=A0A8H4AFK6_GIGMA|nr:hypothetical protein F8M41_022140 [Gigaspora margarita]